MPHVKSTATILFLVISAPRLLGNEPAIRGVVYDSLERPVAGVLIGAFWEFYEGGLAPPNSPNYGDEWNTDRSSGVLRLKPRVGTQTDSEGRFQLAIESAFFPLLLMAIDRSGVFGRNI